MNKPRKRYGIDLNSPVVIGMTAICFLAVVANGISLGMVNRAMAVYYTSWADPAQYLRLFTHVLAHGDMAHYTSNFLLILAVGPAVEEKYGSGRLALMMAVTALITGLINVILFRNVALLGASGIVFMMILLASFTNLREGRVPMTVLLVAVLYIGNEVVSGITSQDNVSQLSHILGGICGAAFGLAFHLDKIRHRED